MSERGSEQLTVGAVASDWLHAWRFRVPMRTESGHDAVLARALAELEARLAESESQALTSEAEP